MEEIALFVVVPISPFFNKITEDARLSPKLAQYIIMPEAEKQYVRFVIDEKGDCEDIVDIREEVAKELGITITNPRFR